MLEYSGGALGVSAVPGSGKTAVLSHLAARLVARLAAEGRAGNDGAGEVLIVTFTNSAVENFRERIGRLLRAQGGPLPGMGYRVRTLHALAHDIVRERPALVGLGDDFGIVDERTAADLKRELVISHVRATPESITAYVDARHLANLAGLERTILEDAVEAVTRFIRLAKELRRTPAELQRLRAEIRGALPLFDLGLAVYADYQRALERRGSVDFDDLIVLALRALEHDRSYLHRLQERWPYVLEDEAQDSSLLQEQMLRTLTRRHGNWVRVGDPNQAINTTFTGANTLFLQRFLNRPTTVALDLPDSGRSAQPILELANALIDWSRGDLPVAPELALPAGVPPLAPPHIRPAPPDDPQPNPPPGAPAVYLFNRPQTPEEEIDTVMRSLRRWLPLNPGRTVAVLVPENRHGFRMTEALANANLPFDDVLLRTDAGTRAGAQALADLVGFVAHPQEARRIAEIWRSLWWPQIGAILHAQPEAELTAPLAAVAPVRTLQQRKLELPEAVERFGRLLTDLREPEQFVFPHGRDWLDDLALAQENAVPDALRPLIERFRRDLQRWSAAVILPIDELILTLGNDIFTDPLDLALAHRLALLLEQRARARPDLHLPGLAAELDAIAANQRRFTAPGADSEGYVARPGVVTVGTLHAAKGLEWDRVHILGVSNYGFPAGGAGDGYRGERWYLRNNLNLAAETEAQLRTVAAAGSVDAGPEDAAGEEVYAPGQASAQARADIAAERLRLLYVGITRARRELILSWNVGVRPGERQNKAALAFRALLPWQAARASIGQHGAGG